MEKQKIKAMEAYKKTINALIPEFEPMKCCIIHCENSEPLMSIVKLKCSHAICDSCFKKTRYVASENRSKVICIKCPLCRNVHKENIPSEKEWRNNLIEDEPPINVLAIRRNRVVQDFDLTLDPDYTDD